MAAGILLGMGMCWAFASLRHRETEGTLTTRRRVVANILNDVYCRLGVTEHGVGVRAIRPIPRGTDPFKTVDRVHDIVWVATAELAGAHPGVRAMAADFLGQAEEIPLNHNGLNAITIDFFMNHNARTPNMTVVPGGGENTYASFRATRDIRAGEELTYDYKLMGAEHPVFAMGLERGLVTG